MPLTAEQVEQKLKEFQSQIDVMKKDYEIKLDAEKKNAQEWKTVAESKIAEAKKFEEKAAEEKAKREKDASEVREKETKAFVEEQVKAGRIKPTHTEACIKLMQSLSSEGEVAHFSDKSGKKISHSQLSIFKEIILGIAKNSSVNMSELGLGRNYTAPTPGGEDEESNQTVRVFMAGKGFVEAKLDETELATKAYEYQEAQSKNGKTISYEDALLAVAPRKTA